MQQFVANISTYAKSCKPEFIIIPQNGIELAFNNTEPSSGLNSTYMSAINGLGVEELFYNGTYSPDNERLSMLRQLKVSKKVMVSEYVTDNGNINDAINRNVNEGFLCFIRTSNNYHYNLIPTNITNSNPNSIYDLSAAQNFLYLISSDSFSTSQEMIDAIAATNYDVILIDMFFKGTALSANQVSQLKVKPNGAKRLVISYINIGAAEQFRYYWKSSWDTNKPKWIKKPYQGYSDEFWVEFWNPEWQSIIYGNNDSYIKRIIDAGFDGAYLDNVEAYYFLYHD